MFRNEEEYNKLSDEDRKYASIANTYYKGDAFQEKYKQAFVMYLMKYFKQFYESGENIDKFIPEEIKQRNMEYLASSDELFGWFNDKFEITDNRKDIIKVKDIYDVFKTEDIYLNASKAQRRQMTCNNFRETLSNNMFLKRYLTINKDKIHIMTNIKQSTEDSSKTFGLDTYDVDRIR